MTSERIAEVLVQVASKMVPWDSASRRGRTGATRKVDGTQVTMSVSPKTPVTRHSSLLNPWANACALWNLYEKLADVRACWLTMSHASGPASVSSLRRVFRFSSAGAGSRDPAAVERPISWPEALLFKFGHLGGKVIDQLFDLAKLSFRDEAALASNWIKDRPEGSRLQNLRWPLWQAQRWAVYRQYDCRCPTRD